MRWQLSGAKRRQGAILERAARQLGDMNACFSCEAPAALLSQPCHTARSEIAPCLRFALPNYNNAK
jgi:hypothetical protein